MDEWKKIAMKELKEVLELDSIEIMDEGNNDSFEVSGEGSNNNESEWTIYKDWDSARYAAEERIKEDLNENPEYFNTDFIKNYLMIYDTDKRIIASEESDHWVDSTNDKDLLEEVNMLSEYEEIEEQIDDLEGEDEPDEEKLEELNSQLEKILDDTKEEFRNNKYDEIYEKLSDPIDYFCNEQGIYPEDELLKQSFISIDEEEATEAAISADGIGNYLDCYDGEEVELPSGSYAFGTN